MDINQENLQNAINSINCLDIPSEKKEALIHQLKAAIPDENFFKSEAESFVYDLNKYDSCALHRTHVRIGTSENGQPCVYVWYSEEGRTSFVILYYASWKVLNDQIRDRFLRNLNDYFSDGGDLDLVGADRIEDQSLDVVEVMRSLAYHGATVSTI